MSACVWGCDGVCVYGAAHRSSSPVARRVMDIGDEWRKRAERADRFARLWKGLARRAYLRRASLIAAAYEAGERKERLRILAMARGMMCDEDAEDCDLCIAYQAVITTIEANP